jgi:multidrug efflux pump subunit AcrA (membrane-fusion protein)
LQKIRKAIAGGKITAPADGHLTVRLGLQTEDGFPHEAIITFMDNQVNSTTGSIPVRGVFRNLKLIPAAKGSSAAGAKAPAAEKAPAVKKAPAAEKAQAVEKAPTVEKAPATPEVAIPGLTSSIKFDRLFSPGMFVRVQLPMGEPHQALLIIDRAIQSDQGLKYVYVLDAENKVQMRSIQTGALQQDGLRVVEGEIKPDDWVIVGAIQQVRAQMEVKPDRRPMPSIAGQSEAAPPAAK